MCNVAEIPEDKRSGVNSFLESEDIGVKTYEELSKVALMKQSWNEFSELVSKTFAKNLAARGKVYEWMTTTGKPVTEGNCCVVGLLFPIVLCL